MTSFPAARAPGPGRPVAAGQARDAHAIALEFANEHEILRRSPFCGRRQPERALARAACATGGHRRGRQCRGVPYLLSGQGIGPVSAEITPMLSFLIGGVLAVATAIRFRCKWSVRSSWRARRCRWWAMICLASSTGSDRSRATREIGVPLDRPLLGFQAREAGYVGFSAP